MVVAMRCEIGADGHRKAKEDGVDYRTALSEVHRENPELAREYQRQIPRCDD